MELKEEIISNISQNILHNCKFKKLDAYSIFRYLTGKQTKRNPISIDLSKIDLPVLSEQDIASLNDFIIQVNPFFNMNDSVKLDYYKKNYFVAQKVFVKCQKYLEERNIIAFYRIKQTKNSIASFMTFYDLDDRSPTNSRSEVAQYAYKDQVLEQANKFLALYRFLKLDMSLEILGFNSNDEILEKFVVN